LSPGQRFAADEMGPSSVNLGADNPIPRKLKVAAGLTADRHGGGVVLLDKVKSRQHSVDVVIGEGSAELSAQVASSPVVDPQHRCWWKKSRWRRKPAHIGGHTAGAMLNASAATPIANDVLVTAALPNPLVRRAFVKIT